MKCFSFKDIMRLNIILGIVIVAFGLELLDTTIAWAVIPDISSSLNTNNALIYLALSAYLISNAIFIPLGSWLIPKFGSKKIFSCAILFFTVGTLTIATSQSIHIFILGQAIEGLGGALMVPTGRNLLLKVSHQSQHPKILNMLPLCGNLAGMIGPTLGAYITEALSWHFIYLVNIPFLVCLFILTQIYFPQKDTPPLQKPFDFFGFIFLAAASFTGILGANLLSENISNLFLPGSMILFASFFVFLAIKHLKKTQLLIQTYPFSVNTFKSSIISGSLFRMALGGLTMSLPVFLHYKYNYTYIEAGSVMIFQPVGLLCGRFLSTKLYAKVGYMKSILIGCILSIACILTILLASKAISFFEVAIILLIIGFCQSLVFTGCNCLTFYGFKGEEIGNVNVLMALFQKYSFAFSGTIVALTMTITNAFVNSNHSHTLSIEIFMMISISLILISIINMIQTETNIGVVPSKSTKN